MKHFNLLSSILREPWLIDQGAAAGYGPMIAAMIKGKHSEFGLPEGLVSEVAKSSEEVEFEFNYWLRIHDQSSGKVLKVASYSQASPGSLALIPLKGVLMKEDAFCGPAGMDTTAAMIMSAAKNPNISAIVVPGTTPGGMVMGTENLANTIAKASKLKPIVGWADGMVASAGMWNFSPMSLIIIANETSEMGSIGTMISVADMAPAWEKMGVKFHEVRATESVDKNESFYQLLKGNYGPYRKESLDPKNEVFMNTIKVNREGKMDLKKENVLTGKMYHGSKAIEVGLADEMGDFDYAIQRAYELANQFIPINLNQNENEMFGTKFSKLEAIAAKQKKGEAITAEDIEAANAEMADKGVTGITLALDSDLEAINNNVADKATLIARLEKEIATAEAAKTTAEEALATATSSITALTTERDEAQALAVKFGAKAGDTHTNPKKEKDEDDSKKDDEEASFESFPHNQEALAEIKNFG